jgi:hypothetical protein
MARKKISEFPSVPIMTDDVHLLAYDSSEALDGDKNKQVSLSALEDAFASKFERAITTQQIGTNTQVFTWDATHNVPLKTVDITADLLAFSLTNVPENTLLTLVITNATVAEESRTVAKPTIDSGVLLWTVNAPDITIPHGKALELTILRTGTQVRVSTALFY